MRMRRALLAMLALAALSASVARSDDDKDKDKDKAAKPKPATRSYSDDDLKKYKAPPKESGADAQPTPAAGDSGGSPTDEAAPRQRRSHEYGGYQKEDPPPPTRPRATLPGKVDSTPPEAPVTNDSMSPEEADWRSRARQARAPMVEAEGRIKELESQIGELRDKLNPMSTSYVLGGNSNAGPGAILEVQEQLQNLDNALAEAKGAAAEAEKSWRAFLEEARAAGVSPAWLKP